ncbi:MAG: DUF1109 family protein [Acidobacteria bacterium]|nr:DUF1109 family protein [Acidobacteriota bacterium]
MIKDTDGLIRRLAEKIEPVRPLSHPWVRTAAWLALSVPYIAVVVLLINPRQDLSLKIWDPRYVIEQAAAIAVGIAAAAAAFTTTIPGYNSRFLMLPALPLVAWLGMLGHGCIQDWIQFGLDGLSVRPDWLCLPVIALIGAFPATAIAVMLRRGAPLTPHLTAALGGLAAAGLGGFGLRLIHPEDASVTVLVWQVGSVFVLSALAGGVGRYLLNWRSITGASESTAR